MSGNWTLLAGFTAPLSETEPDSNQLLNSAGVREVAQLLPASVGGDNCVRLHPITVMVAMMAARVIFMLCDFIMGLLPFLRVSDRLGSLKIKTDPPGCKRHYHFSEAGLNAHLHTLLLRIH